MLLLGCIFTLLATSWAEILEENLHQFIKSEEFQSVYGHGSEDYEITIPIHTGRIDRSINEHPEDLTYTLEVFGNRLELNLKKSFDDSEIRLVSRNADGSTTEEIKNVKGCQYHGSISSQEGWVAVSTCDGLTGIIRTKGQDYVVHALPEHLRNKRDAKFPDEIPHVVFKQGPIHKSFCGKVDRMVDEVKSTVRRQANAQNARKLTVETAMFVDLALYNYFRTLYPRNTDDNILQFTMSTINAIQHNYNHVSLIGKPVVFVVIRVDIMKNIPAGLRVVDDAESYLWNFCGWQSTVNPGDDTHPDHWDHTFLLTGIDIKSNGNSGTIGIAPMRGMCNPRLSCTVTESKYFMSVITGSHEAGHNFGMEHDSDKNPCDGGKFIMAAFAGEGQTDWSTCSRKYMIDFLRDPQTVCLLDERNPPNHLNHEAHELPGQIYNADVQCQMAFGNEAQRDRQRAQHEICDTLKCEKNLYVYTAHSALEGTHCAQNSWCRGGRCVNWGRQGAKSVNGGWGPFSAFSICESACLTRGSGVSVSSRDCNNPSPQNGGMDCQGDRSKINFCSDNNICRYRQTNEQFAAQVCANAPSNIAPSIVARGGQLFHDQTGGCLVWCEKRSGGGQYSGFGKTFPDGTDCSQGNGRAFCLSGMCRRI